MKKTEQAVTDMPIDADQNAPDPNCYFDFMNKLYQANLAKLTLGISPASVTVPYFAWANQLAQAPGSLWKLASIPVTGAKSFFDKLISVEPVAKGEDIRFHKDSWRQMPWRFFAESFLWSEEWWRQATTEVPGLSKRALRTIAFGVRQALDAYSPSNFITTNPDLFHETITSMGLNLFRGTETAWEHMLSRAAGMPPPGAEKFIPGKNVAITPGKVVFSNHLIELIQYKPTTETVYKEPILILPAWIMKYYILDLSPHNSLVAWLVKQGHTVFMVSWRNPDEKDRDLSFDDYHHLGAMAAIDAVTRLIPKTKMHLVGYCLGGTLAMISAATMAKNKDNRLKSLTLLAAQGDFTEAGELMLYITKSEVSFLENMMWDQGYLDTKQMAGSFQMLRSYDLIWSKIIQDYMGGKERGMIDLLAWNADATRMPYKMHSEYLDKLFLNNDFAEGRFKIEGDNVAPKNIELPIFAVSTEHDHVAPWGSVYKIHIMANADINFVLTSGGHNAGIVSEPGHSGRYYYIQEHKKNTPYMGPKKWLRTAEKKEGSWWLAWQEWLVQRSSAERVPARVNPVSEQNAPGTYVLQK